MYLYMISNWDVMITWAGIGILGSLIITWVNYRGIKLTTSITFILTLLIIGAGILLITGSSVAGNTQNMEPLFNEGIAGLLTVVIMTPFMFVGFDVIPGCRGNKFKAEKDRTNINFFSDSCGCLVYCHYFWRITSAYPI